MAQNYNVQWNRFNGTDYDKLLPQNSITATTNPTTSTKGFLGQRYFNTTTNEIWECTGINGSVYTWSKALSPDTVLSDETKEVYGLPNTATPNDAFNSLATNMVATRKTYPIEAGGSISAGDVVNVSDGRVFRNIYIENVVKQTLTIANSTVAGGGFDDCVFTAKDTSNVGTAFSVQVHKYNPSTKTWSVSQTLSPGVNGDNNGSVGLTAVDVDKAIGGINGSGDAEYMYSIIRNGETYSLGNRYVLNVEGTVLPSHKTYRASTYGERNTTRVYLYYFKPDGTSGNTSIVFSFSVSNAYICAINGGWVVRAINSGGTSTETYFVNSTGTSTLLSGVSIPSSTFSTQNGQAFAMTSANGVITFQEIILTGTVLSFGDSFVLSPDTTGHTLSTIFDYARNTITVSDKTDFKMRVYKIIDGVFTLIEEKRFQQDLPTGNNQQLFSHSYINSGLVYGFGENSYEAIALQSGTSPESIEIIYDGVAPLSGITAGTQIVSSGVNGYSPQDGWLWVRPYWEVPFGTRITRGVYIGTNSAGASGASTLTFDFKPQVVLILPSKSTSGTLKGGRLFMIQGCNGAVCDFINTSIPSDVSSPVLNTVVVSWSGNSVSWYAQTGGYIPQNNDSTTTYSYVAIG